MKKYLEGLGVIAGLLLLVGGAVGVVVALTILVWPKHSLPGQIATVSVLGALLGGVVLSIASADS